MINGNAVTLLAAGVRADGTEKSVETTECTPREAMARAAEAGQRLGEVVLR